MLRYFLSLIVLSICLKSNAQSYEVNWGQAYKKEGARSSYLKLLGSDEDYYYLVSRPKTAGEWIKFNYNHDLISKKPLGYSYNKKPVWPSDFIQTENNTFAIFSQRNKKQQEVTVHMSELDKAGNTKGLQLLNAYPFSKSRMSGIFKRFYGFGEFIVSPNKTRICYIHAEPPIKGTVKPDDVNITIYNENMAELWKRSFQFPYKENKLSLEQYFVTDDGRILITATHWKDLADREKRTPRYDYKFFEIDENSVKEYSIELKDERLPVDAGIFMGDDGLAYLGGFFTEKTSKVIGANGVFYVKIDLEKDQIVAQNSEKFNEEFLEDIATKKEIKKDRGLTAYDIYELYTFADGSFSFVAEENYITEHTYTTSDGSIVTKYIYHTNEIVVPRFSKEGSIIAVTKVLKTFQSEASIITSYLSGMYENDLFLVFNDQKTKAERKDLGKQGKRTRYTDFVKINVSGDIEIQKTLFSSREIETEFFPSMSTYVQSGDRLLLYGQQKKQYQFGHINLAR